MKILRKACDRAAIKMGWLKTHHTFSFASYFDPEWMGFSKLRVINEDQVEPDNGFGAHPHRNMEIITFMLAGELEHRDTMGEHTILHEGEIQVMSAGHGIMHSEFNPSSQNKSHFLQIWIEPNELDVKPRYTQFKVKSEENALTLLASESESEHVAKIHQDAKIYLGHYSMDNKLILNENRKYWLHVYAGQIKIENDVFGAGDALGITEENELLIQTNSECKFLFFDLP